MAPTARLATILAFAALATAQTNPEDQAFIVSTTAPISAAAAQTVTVTATATITQGSATPTITAVSECHAHGTTNWCMADTEEYQISGPTATEEFQAQYTDCHKHGSEIYCVDDAGEDVEILVEFTEASGGTHSGETTEKAAGSEENCHFHAGVEHCVGGSKDVTCDATDRDYNMPLRVGLLFVILVTSAFGVFLPILTTRFNIISQTNIVLVILKQFGTGIVLSTAFIHLFTHADLMFGNECLGELQYEGTTAAVFLAGLFLSFLADYLGVRFVQWRQKKRTGADSETRGITTEGNDKGVSASASPEDDLNGSHGSPHAHGPFHHATVLEEKINVLNLEAGIIFHSILIGITLVVAGDSFFLTLFIVILFHQMFEGIALGACIAELPKAAASTVLKCIMAGAFALITPIGMAIGIGVLDSFNGNDPHTIVAIGTLDALSAGILAWVGIVEMLARDWMHGRLLNAGLMRTLLAMFALICGMILMSVLGKWA